MGLRDGRIVKTSLVHLEYFCVAARLEHVTRAAEELSITQPSLSKAIAQLEEELGVRLFDRVGRQIRLNHYGEALLGRVERASRELEQARREIADLASGEEGFIELAIHAGTQLLPDLLSAFRRQYPRIRFRASQLNAPEAFEQLERGEVDLCITCPPPQRPGIVSVPLVTEEVVLAVPPDHRFAGRERVPLSEVADEAFISLKPGYNLRNISDAIMRQAGLSFRFAFEGDNPAVIPNLIRAGLGIGFVPAITWSTAMKSSLVLLRITGTTLERTLGLSWREDRYPSRAEQHFRRFVVAYFSGLS